MGELEDLAAAISAHPATLANEEWSALGASLKVYRGNATELGKLLTSIATDMAVGFAVMATGPDSPRIVAEVRRLLHNYVASVKSLVDHTRALVEPYPEGESFRVDYEARKAVIIAVPVTAFFNDLRNFILHRQIPEIIRKLSVSGHIDQASSYVAMVGLPVWQLLQWENWGAAARGYIEGAADGVVDLRAALLEHEPLVVQLNSWLFDQYVTLHGDEIDEVNALIRRLNELRAQPPQDH